MESQDKVAKNHPTGRVVSLVAAVFSLVMLACSFSGEEILLPWITEPIPTLLRFPSEKMKQAFTQTAFNPDPATPTLTATSISLFSYTDNPTASPSVTGTVTPSATNPSQTPTLTRTATRSRTPTATFTSTDTPSDTPAQSSTMGFGWYAASPTPSATPSSTQAFTFTASTSPSATASRTPTVIRPVESPTPSPTQTPTPSLTYTATVPSTPTSTWTLMSPTDLNSPTPSQTPTATLVPSQTSTPTVSSTPTWTTVPSQTPTPTISSTPSVTPVPTNTIPASPTPAGCIPIYNDAYEAQVIALINNERIMAGLPALSMHPSLMISARGHSTDMAVHNFMSHTGSDGSSAWTRMVRAGYVGRWGGENIYAGWSSGSPQDAVTWWMNSAPHRANILGVNYRDIGVGYAYCVGSSYRNYYTVNFGAP